MSKIGAHMLIWTSTLNNDTINVFHKIKEIGFDGVEIIIPDPMKVNFSLIQKMRGELKKLGLECTGSAGLGANANLVDQDASIRQKGKKHLKRWVDIFSDLNCSIIAGVLYGTFEVLKGRGRTKKEWEWAVNLLQEAANYAKEKNITLALEVINRYESYFLNTAEDGIRLLQAINRDNVKLHLDTYHMNIEEKNFYTPIVKSRGYLGHIHCCANDRGIPGTGHVNWDELFKGLSEIAYDGWLVIESFYGPMKEMPIVSSVWRKLADNIEDIPCQGLKFIQEKIKEYGL